MLKKITRLILISLFAIGLPVLALLAGGWAMLEVSGRHEAAGCYANAGVKPNQSLASELWGYEINEAKDYWAGLRKYGCDDTEIRFLKIDLFYALFYAGMTALAIYTIGRPRSLPGAALMLLPVIVLLLADWVETAIHLFHLTGGVSDLLIGVSGYATMIKWWSGGLTLIVLVALVVRFWIVEFNSKSNHLVRPH